MVFGRNFMNDRKQNREDLVQMLHFFFPNHYEYRWQDVVTVSGVYKSILVIESDLNPASVEIVFDPIENGSLKMLIFLFDKNFATSNMITFDENFILSTVSESIMNNINSYLDFLNNLRKQVM